MPKKQKQSFAEQLTGRSKGADKRVTSADQVKKAVGSPRKKKKRDSALRRFILNRTQTSKITKAMDEKR